MALILPGCVWLELSGRVLTPAWLLLLGNASYALYLMHDPVVSLATEVIRRVDVLDSWFLSLAIGTILAISGGVAYHLVIEKPALSYFNRLAPRRAQPVGAWVVRLFGNAASRRNEPAPRLPDQP